MARSVAMDGRVWRRLPFDLVRMVLSFLPVPELCRYRAVCKGWDSLISSSKFRTLSRHNARKGLGYIVARVAVDNSQGGLKFHGWSVLDLDARRWYRIEHDQTPMLGGAPFGHVTRACVATDAGLVCEMVFGGSTSDRDPLIRIFNPLMRREIALLPDIPFHCGADPECGQLNIIANVDGSFKVFYINADFGTGCYCKVADKHMSHCVMPIFDSNSGQWRSSTNPPLVDNSPHGELLFGDPCSTVMFQGHLFVLCSAEKERTTIYRLLSYNIDQDMWEDTGAIMHIIDPVNNPFYKSERIRSRPKLIVSDDRLFYLAWISDDHGDVFSPSFCVCEVSLADQAHWEVFKMTTALVQLVFRTSEETGENGWSFDVKSDIVVMGSYKSIILMSRKTGITMEYDLMHNLLDCLPTNPMHPLPHECELWYGLKTMDLCLPDLGR